MHVVAHRGDSAHYPENTLESFRAALEAGADLVELDVQLTRDGELAVIHDPTLDRTTDGRGPVAERSLAEIQRLSAGYPVRFDGAFASARVPALPEALELLRGRARVLVEIKPESVAPGGDDGIEARLVAAIGAAGMSGDVGVASFHPLALERCRRLAPQVPRIPLFKDGDAAAILARARALQATLVLPHKGLLSDALRDGARAAGVHVAAWVVDEPEELAALARFELYGIGTNRPGVMLEALRRAGG